MKHLNVAIPTPFHDDESLYVEGFKPVINHLKENGIESFLVSGTTGEQHSMSIDERMEIIDYFNNQQFQGVELIFGVSATRTKEVIKLIRKVEDSVFHSVLLQFPPYIKPTQQQAIHYVNELLEHTTKNVVLYNNPSRTGFDLEVASLQTLINQSHPHLVGLKEESDVKRHNNTQLPDNFILFAGGDINFPAKIIDGCNGLSSMVGNVYPKEIKQAFYDIVEKREVNLHNITQLINEVTSNQAIVHIKNHYNSLGIKVGRCRSPII
ncbi:dihydrodipicolinate synthase family protein [Priestia taiwanensis]|uniref:4-hydroxy-tetrahydrodipicolinate synthase n=1 Tax=Priestia taiwanensis TaxID=1347902 RepID=A0A917AKV0_9BACI|nr:dihydrodipicolinate synthase family protein [Priestia taiwanensis]MBM7361938.1 4-hydroxy-tetrahydrodipicolinate synthase [Priestia taiwanensis]GGE58179.1 4-hydroxy-tetrahydrodipicolinate synthase [Priestia taiwanensis]